MLRRLLFFLCSLAMFASQVIAATPNIVFILADDLGWSDLGCYGSPWHETPNLDRLAEQGMRFTQACSPAPICSASRAAMLTGKTPARLGFEFVTKNPGDKPASKHPLLAPPYTPKLPLEEVTLAEMLAPAGMKSGFFGKWHVSEHQGGYLGWSQTHGPLAQGFHEGDSDFGAHPYGYPKRDGTALTPLAEGEFPADSLTDRAVDFIEANRARPFFLYLSHYFVHDPIHSRSASLLKKYRAKLPADAGADRAAYAAIVETLDHLVGRVMRALDKLGLAQDTVVVFTSDNGGNPNFSANGPLRGSKWNLYEGGIRVPLIVRWPGVVQPGTTCAEPATGCDLFPTFREIAAARDDGVERDGRSLVPLLRGDPAPSEPRPLVWHFPYYHPEKGFDKAPSSIGVNDFITSQTRPQSAIRIGSHKLIHHDESDHDELYDLHADISEQRDLAAAEPGRTRELRQQLDAYLKRVHARMPIPNPNPNLQRTTK